MTPSTSERIVILAAADSSAASGDVVRTAALLGQQLANAELHFVCVVEPMTGALGPEAQLSPMKEVVDEARKGLAIVCSQAGVYFGGRIQAHLVVGPPRREILQL